MAYRIVTKKCEIGHSAVQKCGEFERSISRHGRANGLNLRHKIAPARGNIGIETLGIAMRCSRRAAKDFAWRLIYS